MAYTVDEAAEIATRDSEEVSDTAWNEEDDNIIADLLAEESFGEEDSTETDPIAGTVYRLQCPDGHFYIGSTKMLLEQRLAGHKFLSERKKTLSPLYRYIDSIGGWTGVTITTVSQGRVTHDRLYEMEEDEIRKYLGQPLCLNELRVRPTREETRTWDEMYKQPDVEEIKKCRVAFRAANPEFLAQRAKEYAESEKYFAEFRKRNIARILEYKSEKIQCPNCKEMMTRGSITRHMKSKSCIAKTAEHP